MARDYWFAFGSRPAANASLAPSFITFVNGGGSNIIPPAVAETPPGSGLYRANYNATQTIAFVLDGATTGLADSIRYIMGAFDPQDQFGQTLIPIGNNVIAFGQSLVSLGNSNVALGTTAVALGTNTLAGQVSILLGIQAGATQVAGVGQTLVAQGDTLVAIGNTLLGIDPVSISGIGNTASPFGDNVTQPDTLFGYIKRVVEFLEGNQAYAKGTGALTYSARGGQTLLATKTISDSTTETTRS